MRKYGMLNLFPRLILKFKETLVVSDSLIILGKNKFQVKNLLTIICESSGAIKD